MHKAIKNFGFLFSILAMLSPITGIAQSKSNYAFDPGNYVIDGNDHNFNPGDTITLMPGNWHFLLLKNVHGSEDAPITVKNGDGIVKVDSNHYFGIKIGNCSYIKFSGAGNDENYYGIQILRTVGAGLSIDDLSSDVEVEQVEIANVPYAGIYAKTDPNCTFESLRDNFTMFNTIIHDCYIHDVGNEGLYIGSSKYNGTEITCDGQDTLVYPHVNKGVQVYNNIIENTGWDGIQVSSAVADCQIYDNLVIEDSKAAVDFQMSGVLIGGGSQCDCYNNIIRDGLGDGIDILGLGNQKIYNNLIVNPGRDYNEKNVAYPEKHGIYIGDVNTLPDASFYFFNNTIVNPKTFGIKMTNEASDGNKAYNNIIVKSGAYNTYGDGSYIRIENQNIEFDISNNYFSPVFKHIKFTDTVVGNFTLRKNSPAIDAGINLGSYGVNFDLYNNTRPYGNAFDIGAFEYNPNNVGIIEFKETKGLLKGNYPNPFKNKTIIEYELPEPSRVKLMIFSPQGKLIRILENEQKSTGKHKATFQPGNLAGGLYFYKLWVDDQSFTKKMLFLTNQNK
ncbi:MAG: right-handed parallel beta-helix repeat-containing protein [Bacteroidales bacterium]|nr:right-handed parallel beta-helix repeat-containing protein [Bacteroidales bacterium]